MITQFHEATNDNIRNILQHLNATRERVRIFYGNTEHGDAWPEENDVVGYIGNSTGANKIPLLVYNSRSLGGGALLDHCIVAIYSTSGRELYKHPKFSTGTWEHGAEDYSVLHNGIIHARFKTWQQAENYILFMRGVRFCK